MSHHIRKNANMTRIDIRKNIFACLFSIHDAISLHVINKYKVINLLYHGKNSLFALQVTRERQNRSFHSEYLFFPFCNYCSKTSCYNTYGDNATKCHVVFFRYLYWAHMNIFLVKSFLEKINEKQRLNNLIKRQYVMFCAIILMKEYYF